MSKTKTDSGEKKRRFIKKDLLTEELKRKTVKKGQPKKSPAEEMLSLPTRKVEEKIGRELLEIYENDDGSMPDMKKFGKKKSRGLLTAFLVLLFACLFLGMVAWVGFFVFQPKTQFQESDVILDITGDEKIVLGQEVKYRVRYVNDQNTPLSKTLLQIRYPDGFVFENSSIEPSNEAKDEWALGSINPHGSGYLDITGKMYGNLGDKKSFRVFLNYTPANFSSEFQKVSSRTVEFSESSVELKVEMPSEIFSGEKTTCKITIHKKSEEVVKNLAFIIEPSKTFSKIESQPESGQNDIYQWSIPILNEDQVIDLKGIFNPDPVSGSPALSIKVLGWKDDQHSGDGYVLASSFFDVKLVRTDLKSTLAVNGTVSDSMVEPGKTLIMSLAIKNEGLKAVKNIVIKLNIDAPSYNNRSLLDWQKLDDQNNGDVSGEQQNQQTRRGIIKWDQTKISALKQINPGDEVMIDVNLPIKNGADVNLSQFIANQIIAWIEMSYKQGEENKTLSGTPLKLTVNSDLNLEIKDMMDSDPDGLEIHKVIWLLSNSFHELKNIQLEAEIYGDFTWQEEGLVVPAGKAVFDDKEKKLVWKVDNMPISLDVLGLQFSIVLNKDNLSQTNLTSKVKMEAIDVITGQEINKVVEGVLLK